MYGIFPYIWLIFKVNVGKYTIHGSYGLYFGTTPLPVTVAVLFFADECLDQMGYVLSQQLRTLYQKKNEMANARTTATQ